MSCLARARSEAVWAGRGEIIYVSFMPTSLVFEASQIYKKCIISQFYINW